MKNFLLGLTLLLSSSAFAQVNVIPSGNSEGTNKILGAAYWRMSQQKDAWFEDGDFPAAIAMLAMEVIWRPYDYQTVTDLGWMYGNIERKDLELATYIRFREAFPKDPEAYYPEAEFYFKLKKYSQTVNLLEPTVSMDKKPHPNTYRLLAHSLDRIGRLEDSLKIWEMYIALAPDDAAAKVNRDKVKSKISDGKS
ncbi:MAG: hypothetical protein KF824_04315 [Fimbriimonadaceae bacterium]|nr:MAG: hypothetical protein KF824_04315 [Fimbriimonadaceae bacterium]